ncbi:hypothetical protein M9Y10_026982 [Tritrichomonas musculus]|uniref:Uncharacterized protein n=1 Tax=Tritrichomonas musculus TaxID=1915356 RepID=A0ABR2H725_9EUKA
MSKYALSTDIPKPVDLTPYYTSAQADEKFVDEDELAYEFNKYEFDGGIPTNATYIVQLSKLVKFQIDNSFVDRIGFDTKSTLKDSHFDTFFGQLKAEQEDEKLRIEAEQNLRKLEEARLELEHLKLEQEQKRKRIEKEKRDRLKQERLEQERLKQEQERMRIEREHLEQESERKRIAKERERR